MRPYFGEKAYLIDVGGMINKKVMLYICWFFFFSFFPLAFLQKRIHKTAAMHVITACHLCDFDLKMHLPTGFLIKYLHA